MAQNYRPGLSVGTTKYSFVTYGSGWPYGINYPPPVPENLQVEGGPDIVDDTPTFYWVNPTFSWEIGIGDGDDLLYEMQIAFNDPTFLSINTTDTNEFAAGDLTYTLAPEYALGAEGTYYARIRSTDGYTYSDWSTSLKFVLFLFSPQVPTIDPVTSPADGFWQVITGTKEEHVFIFVSVNDGELNQAEYPDGINGTTWSFNVPLSSGDNEIEVYAAYTVHTTGAISLPAKASIYLIMSTPEVFNVWNHFDEIGLTLGLQRLPGETNKKYKERLLDVYVNKANSTYDGLRNGIARELGLNPGDIEIENLSDLLNSDYDDNLLNEEGHAIGTRLEDYAKEVYDNNPVFLGNIVSDESFWDGVDEESAGYSYLPHIWDPKASGIYPKWQRGGIGDQDDLFIKKVDEVWNPGISGYSWYLFMHTGYFYSSYPSGILTA